MKKYLDYVEEDIPNIFARWSMMAVLQAIEASKAIQTHIEVCIIYASTHNSLSRFFFNQTQLVDRFVKLVDNQVLIYLLILLLLVA